MEKEIFELIRRLNDSNGLYREKHFLFEKGKDIIRVNISDGNVIVHALDISMPKSIQIEIYDDDV